MSQKIYRIYNKKTKKYIKNWNTSKSCWLRKSWVRDKIREVSSNQAYYYDNISLLDLEVHILSMDGNTIMEADKFLELDSLIEKDIKEQKEIISKARAKIRFLKQQA